MTKHLSSRTIGNAKSSFQLEVLQVLKRTPKMKRFWPFLSLTVECPNDPKRFLATEHAELIMMLYCINILSPMNQLDH
uniref:Uncharacterized protein n=1 Tax=Rhizophora mucronata TaxID=61149 RepID=A0A2P2P085_RHIMU